MDDQDSDDSGDDIVEEEVVRGGGCVISVYVIVNPYTASELVRLCLRWQDVDDQDSDDSGDDIVEEEVVRGGGCYISVCNGQPLHGVRVGQTLSQEARCE